jgi:predicted transcriptional regulator
MVVSSDNAREIWEALGVTKQGAIKLMQPLLEAGLVQRVGTRKSGHCVLA